jgi:hypothetical protein
MFMPVSESGNGWPPKFRFLSAVTQSIRNAADKKKINSDVDLFLLSGRRAPRLPALPV